ncbi:uncharacterized protein [Antedon mediterranea]|uniref:uncharacterized protein n=1 Tax=Antedon mediterranea TaxID=105859 RepID=UPI003AF74089
MANELVFSVGCVAEVLGLCAIVIILVVGNKAGGFGSYPSFNYHPLFMTLGFVFLFGQGILSFQVIKFFNIQIPRTVEKLIHFGTMSMGCMLMVIGWACADSRDNSDLFTHLIEYNGSPHCSIGLAAIIVFGLQGLVGFSFFLFPKCGSPLLRSKVVKVHRLIGLFSFLMAVIAAMMGATEMALLQSLNDSMSSVRSLLALYVSCVLLFALSVLTIHLRPLLTTAEEQKNYSNIELAADDEMSEMVITENTENC